MSLRPDHLAFDAFRSLFGAGWLAEKGMPRSKGHAVAKLSRSPAELRRDRAARESFTFDFTPTEAGLPVWTVTSASGQSYRVVVPAFPDRDGVQCSCPDFMTRGLGTCKHTEAALAHAALHPPPIQVDPTPPTGQAGVGWDTLERAHDDALTSARRPDGSLDGESALMALRKAGRLLLAP